PESARWVGGGATAAPRHSSADDVADVAAARLVPSAARTSVGRAYERPVQQHQLQCLSEGESELAGRRLSDHYVAALDRPLEDHPRVALCRHCPPGWGRTARPAYTGPGRSSCPAPT